MIALAPNEVGHVYRRYGGVREMWYCEAPDVLLDGPAGTGKSRGILEMMVRDACKYPWSRQAIVRKTRVSLTDSALVTLETKVLSEVDAGYLRDPLMGGPTRATRHIYHFANGSEIACHGMDNPTRLFSTEYDRIYVQEATELSEDEWESLHRALRNNVMPFQQLVGDCNPDAEYHWLNQRCQDGKTKRILSRHKDNPSLTPEYLERLSNLTGVRRMRLFLGLWVSAEGQIWENYDPAVHSLSGQIKPNPQSGFYELRLTDGRVISLTWFFASVDWGFRAPGCLLVWGVDKERNAYLVHQIYRRGRNPEWWADRAVALKIKFNIQRFSCDSEDAGSIDLFNSRMGKVGGEWIARGVEKIGGKEYFKSTSAIVRERLGGVITDPDPKNEGKTIKRHVQPSLFFVAGNLESIDHELKDAHKPTSLETEIPSYVWAEIKDGQPVKDEPENDAVDHGCDALRYGMMFLDRNDWQPAPEETTFKPGTMGALMGHQAVLDRIREREQGY